MKVGCRRHRLGPMTGVGFLCSMSWGSRRGITLEASPCSRTLMPRDSRLRNMRLPWFCYSPMNMWSFLLMWQKLRYPMDWGWYVKSFRRIWFVMWRSNYRRSLPVNQAHSYLMDWTQQSSLYLFLWVWHNQRVNRNIYRTKRTHQRRWESILTGSQYSFTSGISESSTICLSSPSIGTWGMCWHWSLSMNKSCRKI